MTICRKMVEIDRNRPKWSKMAELTKNKFRLKMNLIRNVKGPCKSSYENTNLIFVWIFMVRNYCWYKHCLWSWLHGRPIELFIVQWWLVQLSYCSSKFEIDPKEIPMRQSEFRNRKDQWETRKSLLKGQGQYVIFDLSSPFGQSHYLNYDVIIVWSRAQ